MRRETFRGLRAQASLWTHIPRRLARSEQRLHDASVGWTDRAVAVEIVLAEIVVIGSAIGSLHQTQVHRVHLTVSVHVPVTLPLRITDTQAFAGTQLQIIECDEIWVRVYNCDATYLIIR